MDKEKSTEKIDAAVATIMALDRAIRNHGSEGSVYDGDIVFREHKIYFRFFSHDFMNSYLYFQFSEHNVVERILGKWYLNVPSK